MPYPNYGNKFLQSFFPYISRIWNNLSSCTQSKELIDFKTQLKLDMKPVKIKHFSVGSKDGNSLLARFRTGRTSLNLYRFTIGQEDDPSCMCHAKEESSIHFMMDCFLYTAERQTLLVRAALCRRFRRKRRRPLFCIFFHFSCCCRRC